MLAALLTLGLLVTVWWGAHHWYKGQLLADRRAQILTELSPYSNALSRAINRRLGLLSGLKAFVEAHASAPTFGAEFETFAAGLYAGTAGIRHFVAAPGGVLRYVYPLAGNESVLGYDILHDSRPNVRADVERAIRSRLLTVSGPFELLPGGSGFVGRLAVYVNDKFWGLVSVAVDLPAILEESGIRANTPGLLLALRNELGHPFFGNSAVFNDQPVLHRIELVEGFWELAAAPTGGWNASIRRALRLFDLAALAIASLLTAIVYLVVNRDVRLALGVQERTEELRKAHDELEIRVRERTAELAKSNEALQTEIGERKRAEEEVRFLATLAQAVSEDRDFNSALGTMLRKVCESTGWDYGEAWVLSQDGTALECSPVWYGSGERLERFRKAASGIRRSPGVGLIGRVWVSKKPEWLPDVSVSPGLFYRARAAHEAGLKAGLGLPILAGDQLLAVLVFSMFESREKDKRLVEIVSAAGVQLGSVLQRKQMEQALLESERRFHGIFNQTYQFVGLLNPDGILLEANKTALDFRGLQRSDVVGRPFWETAWWDTSPDPRDRLKAAIADAARGNFIRYEVDLLGPDGSVNTFDFSLKPVTDESGQVVLLIPEGRNITNRKQMEEELRRARDELEIRVQERTAELAKANEDLKAKIIEKTRLQEQLIESERLAAIGTTAAKLGHEIANPLNGMSMTLQLLERRLAREAGQVDAGATSAVKRLKDEITRLSQLLEDFRSISRREKYSFQPTALATVAGEVFAAEMEYYSARRIQVEQDFPPDLSLVVADRDKLKQALLNLCKNAVEAMPQGGTLTVRASNTGEQVVLEIMDTGVGIPAEVDIFELFSTTKASGTGLGLMIVRQIVAAHGGTITYASEPGKGTTFRLTLPIVQSLGSKQYPVSSRQ